MRAGYQSHETAFAHVGTLTRLAIIRAVVVSTALIELLDTTGLVARTLTTTQDGSLPAAAEVRGCLASQAVELFESLLPTKP